MLLRRISGCFIFGLLGTVCGQSGDNIKSLLTKLFTTDSYNKNVRPNSNQSQPMILDLDLYLVGINEIDELNQKLTTTGFLYILWTDEYLTWDAANYGGLEKLYISQKDIWKPDITLQNGFTKLKELGSDFIRVLVLENGLVTWLPFEVFETKCKIDITYFPYDEQSCDIIFVVWSSSIEDIKVTLWNNGITLDNLEDNAEWTVVTTSAKEDIDGTSESRVVFTVTLKRSATYYLMNIIIPVILLSILNIFTFVLPADSGEKMGYCITVFLAFAVFLTIVSAELPKTSGSILGYYLMFQLGMGTFVVCCTALELRLHHRKDDVPARIIRILKCRSSKRIHDKADYKKDDTIMDEKQKIPTWDDVISLLDFVLFWITLAIVLIVTISILGVLCSR